LEREHYAAAEIQEKLAALENDKSSLLSLWEDRRILYEQCMDLQLFYRDTEQADTWMAKQEAFLANEDLGDSLDSVEALIKKHEDFEKSLAAQEEKIKALDIFATKLIDIKNLEFHVYLLRIIMCEINIESLKVVEPWVSLIFPPIYDNINFIRRPKNK